MPAPENQSAIERVSLYFWPRDPYESVTVSFTRRLLVDGLKQPWCGACRLNLPYDLALSQWVKKAHESAQAVVVYLLSARTDTIWWHDYVLPHAEARYIRGRMKFNGVENSTPFPSAIVLFRASPTVII